MPLEIGETLASRYKIEEHLVTGDVSELWYARDMILRRKVALRIVREKMLDDSAYLVRFAQESQILAQMEHPHIAPIYDYGLHDERPFQVQRFIGIDNLLAMVSETGTPDSFSCCYSHSATTGECA